MSDYCYCAYIGDNHECPPIEGRILDDEEIKRMRHSENLSSLQRELNESRRLSYQKMRAANFYRKTQADIIDRNSFPKFQWEV